MRGGQWQVFYLARFQAGDGEYTPVVACLKGSPLAKKLTAEGIEIVPLGSNKQWNLITLLRLAAANRRHKFKFIHTHDARAASLGAILRKLWGTGVKLVHTRRVSYPVKGRSLAKYKLADAVVGVSHDTANSLRLSGLAPEQLCVIHSGIDLSRYTPRTAQEVQKHERFIFAMVGALTPQKGHSVLIKAMALLKEYTDMPPWEVRVVGDGPLFGEILAEAKSLEVDIHLSLLGRQDAAKILPQCDAMLVPSVDGEGSSGTVKEAWAVGLPLICSSLAANLELVENEHNGLVFICGLERDLAEAMRRVALDPSLGATLVAAGRESVLHYTADKMAASYNRLYDRLLSFTG